MKLKEVTITRADSCLSYALKRIGRVYSSEEVINYDWFRNQCEQGEFTKVNKPLTGDFLVKLSNKEEIGHVEYSYHPVTILGDGRIVNKRIPLCGFHIAVMERGGTVSELTISYNQDYPAILIRTLGDFYASANMLITIWRWNR